MGCRGIRDWNERSVSVYVSSSWYSVADRNADRSFPTFFDHAFCMSYLFPIIFALVSVLRCHHPYGSSSATDTFLPVHGSIYIHFPVAPRLIFPLMLTRFTCSFYRRMSSRYYMCDIRTCRNCTCTLVGVMITAFFSFCISGIHFSTNVC